MKHAWGETLLGKLKKKIHLKDLGTDKKMVLTRSSVKN
jgi:hypothetical protein